MVSGTSGSRGHGNGVHIASNDRRSWARDQGIEFDGLTVLRSTSNSGGGEADVPRGPGSAGNTYPHIRAAHSLFIPGGIR